MKRTIGDVEIYCGDSFELMNEMKYDLVCTDPPYNFESKGGGFYGDWHGNGHAARTYCDNLSKLDCVDFEPKQLLDAFSMSLFQGYFFCNKKLVLPYLQFAEEKGYMYDILTMNKTNPIPACNSHHLHDLEYIIMIREKGTSFYKQPKFKDNSKYFITQVKQDNIHPAQKPVELMKRLICTLSKENDIIFDPFCGSGTTAIAAIQTKRKCITIEKDTQMFEIACKRIEKEFDKYKINDFFEE